MSGFRKSSGPSLVASTEPTGFALQDATPAILTWTTPNDGNLHSVVLTLSLIVSSAQTGGVVQVHFTIGGQSASLQLYNGGLGTGYHAPSLNYMPFTADPNTTVTLEQTTAQTAGAAALYAQIWAS